MNQDFNFLFQLLKKENINIDKTEFQFQYQSHPDYPSLLAIVDTLTFFDIENNAIKKDFDEIKDLPEYFVALLNEDKSKPTLYLIQKNELDYYKYVNNTFIKIDISDLQKKWKGIVLLISKSSSGAFKTNKPTNLLLFGLVVVILMVQLFISASPIMGKLFLMLPFIGILFSIAALKDLFENKSKIISSICNMSASASCSSVTKASKWKFFEYVNFSDLSITFFSSQFLLLCFSEVFNQGLEVLCFQKTILFFSIPFLLLSIYYQKFVEKKWCPICLIIISILITEIAVLSFLSNLEYNFVQQAITFGFVFTGSYLSWKGLKQLLTVKKELKENQLKSNRFEKNYDLFKTKLLSENNIVPPTNGVILGNQYAKTNITIVSNPFCGHCKEVHTILDKIVEKNKDNLNIKIILRTNLESLDEDSKKLFRGLLYLYYNQGSLAFSKSLKEWFDKRDIKDWLNAYYTENNFNEIDLILQNHLSWTNENEYTFTPAIFINGYEYPKMYDRKNLAYFISEIIEDTDFN